MIQQDANLNLQMLHITIVIVAATQTAPLKILWEGENWTHLVVSLLRVFLVQLCFQARMSDESQLALHTGL